MEEIFKRGENVKEAKWINVVEVQFTYGGSKRNVYFNFRSPRLEKFKKEMKEKIINIAETRIRKGMVWVN